MNGLAICLASRSGVSAAAAADVACCAEAAGFKAMFIAERCADSLALAHSALLGTERITVGTAIANAAVRHPAITALTAATLAEESGGRFLLGLGVANAALNETVLGLPATRPVGYMREYLGVLKAVLAGGGDPRSGEYFSISGFLPDRSPKPVPLYIAALLPRMLALAGELADGVFLNLMTTAQLPSVLGHIESGLAISGRAREEFVVACLMPCCISADADAATRAARQVVAGYAMHPAAGKLFSDSGFAPELGAVRERMLSGQAEAAAASVSQEMIDALVVHGDAEVLAGRISAYREAGVDLPVLFPMPIEDGWAAAMDRVIRAAAPHTASPACPPERDRPQRKDAPHV
ncbi:MAG: LLM class flavin-dependent oxidoreductase [Geodermatophilaceae bacterium]